MKSEIIVRPLLRGEERLWVSIGVPEAEKDTRYQKLEKYLSVNPTLPPEQYLFAFCQGKLVGKMSGIVESTGYIATALHVSEGLTETLVINALLEYVSRFGQQQALSWAREDNKDWRNLLKQAGFVEMQDKAYYRKEISGYISPYIDQFTYQSLAEVGEAWMLKIYRKTYQGNLNRNFNTASPDSDFRSHIESAGTLFDSKSWFVVFENEAAVGVLLPQRFPDDPTDGTLMSVGLVTSARGKGYGKILHAKGMELLARQGATDYIGSTDVQNLPMKRVFEKNECSFIGIRTTHERANAIGAHQEEAFDA